MRLLVVNLVALSQTFGIKCCARQEREVFLNIKASFHTHCDGMYGGKTFIFLGGRSKHWLLQLEWSQISKLCLQYLTYMDIRSGMMSSLKYWASAHYILSLPFVSHSVDFCPLFLVYQILELWYHFNEGNFFFLSEMRGNFDVKPIVTWESNFTVHYLARDPLIFMMKRLYSLRS